MESPKPSKKKPGKVGENKTDVVREVPQACADEAAAVAFMEKRRWGDEPCCPHCGCIAVYQMRSRTTGEREKHWRWRCRDCAKQFSVRTGTVFEDSRIPLRHWCYAFWAACASKKGVSALQIQRQTGLSYKSALFLMHRIRWAMRDEPGSPPKLDGTVEVDETFVGGKPRPKGWSRQKDRKPREKWSTKTPVVALVQRGGDVRANPIDGVTSDNLRSAIAENAAINARIVTDDNRSYRTAVAGRKHDRVMHSLGQYVKSGTDIHTNTVEGFFALLKRQLYGTHHAVSKAHLFRYVDEVAFKYNTRGVDDGERTERAIRQANGKRLRYRDPTGQAT